MGKQICFTHVSESEDCGIVFYDKKTGAEVYRKTFDPSLRLGKLWRISIDTDELGAKAKDNLTYQFIEGEKRVPDKFGKAYLLAKKYGEPKSSEDIYAVLDDNAYDWRGTKNPKVPYNDSLIYCLHLRGFTKHSSSNVKNRGTFLGLIEKIPYLRSIGVTTLEFQPIYEFNERPILSRNPHSNTQAEVRTVSELAEMARTSAQREDAQREPQKLNYWGYTEGFYYAPKAAYAIKDPVIECKDMIRSLHENGMEAILQFYFPKELNPMEIPQILRFWVEEYHADGFHLIGENLPAELIARDPELSETKLWYYQMDTESIYGRRHAPKYKNLGLVRDDFMYEGRRFLKGEEALVSAMTYQVKGVPQAVAKINYMTTYWGFPLMDMVSYDFKHNEANGEDNHDGTDYNCSWNCGEEGPSRKKKIRELRLTQIKNALCMLLLSQGTPRVFMGDEFGNSQKGNNNPYCQDNEITWLNWNLAEKNAEILDFFKNLIAIRTANPVLHPSEEAKLMDSISCGYPDLSFHGETAWRPQLENYSRQLGIMYCGLYGKDVTVKETENAFDFLYLGLNMHWEPHKLGLPRLQKGKKWKLLFATSENGADSEPTADAVTIGPRTVALYVSETLPIVEPEASPKTEEKEAPILSSTT